MKKTTTAVVAALASLALGSSALATMDDPEGVQGQGRQGQLRLLPRREDAEEGQGRPERLRQEGQAAQGRRREDRLVEGPRRAVDAQAIDGLRAPGPPRPGAFPFRSSPGRGLVGCAAGARPRCA